MQDHESRSALSLPAWVLALAALVAAFFTPAAAAEAPSELPGNLVSAHWLAQQMRQPPADLVVIDVRQPPKYTIAHIDHAINVPVERTFSDYAHRARVAPLNRIRNLLSHAGIRTRDRIVLYDNGLLKDAARMFWVLETYGHRQVAVLDGGLPAWIDRGGRISRKKTRRPPSHYVPSMTPGSLATKLTTRLAMDDEGVMLLDSRNAPEYLGLISRAKRAGHIPTAINIPWEQNLDTDHGLPRVRSVEELQALYNGIDRGTPVIAYCNRGKESALSYLMLRELGYEVAVYDGGWLEWGNDPNLPVRNPQLATAVD